MDRIRVHNIPGTQVYIDTDSSICLMACDGAPTSIQPGAVVKMAEALEEVINDNHGLGYTDPITLNRIESVLRAYYGEDK